MGGGTTHGTFLLIVNDTATQLTGRTGSGTYTFGSILSLYYPCSHHCLFMSQVTMRTWKDIQTKRATVILKKKMNLHG